MSIQGYAIRTPAGGIDITTVSPTERAAKVNWLATACDTLVTRSADDGIIESMFAREAEHVQAQCIPVSVSEVT